MATKTSTAVGRVRQLHEGVNAVVAKYVAGGNTLSAGDVIQMVTVPHGAIILDVQLAGVARNTATVFDVGDGGDADRYMNDATLSSTGVVQRMNVDTGLGYQYSISDDVIPQVDTIDLTVVSTASATATGTLILAVTYYMPPMN